MGKGGTIEMEVVNPLRLERSEWALASEEQKGEFERRQR